MNAAGGAPATSIDASYYDTDKILRQAAATFFDHLSEMCEGILLVDREARLVWINDRYERYLGTLGFSSREQVLGRPIEEVVPNTLMRSVVETGRPILIDVIENPTGTFVVSRIPLHDDDGRVIGAIGMILYDQIDSLKPILGRLSRLQNELAAARQQVAGKGVAQDVRRDAGRADPGLDGQVRAHGGRRVHVDHRPSLDDHVRRLAPQRHAHAGASGRGLVHLSIHQLWGIQNRPLMAPNEVGSMPLTYSCIAKTVTC